MLLGWPAGELVFARFLALRSGQPYLHHFWQIFVQPLLYFPVPRIVSIVCLQAPLKLEVWGSNFVAMLAETVETMHFSRSELLLLR